MKNNIEQRLRDSYSEEQLEMFEDNQPPRTIWGYVPGFVILIVVLMLSVTAFAEEKKSVLIRSGIICDSIVQVTEAIDALSAEEPMTIEGCGWVQYPVAASYKLLAEYENELVVAKLVEFHFLNFPVQYSYIAWKPKVKDTPS